MERNYNLRSLGTCRSNKKAFDYEQLLLDQKFNRGTFKKLIDKCLGVVITRWKYSHIL